MPSNNMRNILELSAEERKAFRESFDIVFSDCDGVMWHLANLIEGSGEGANAIANAGKRLVFVSNNSINSEDDYLRKFAECGIDIHLKNVVHPAKSVIRYFRKINFNDLVYCIGGDAFVDNLRNAGYNVITGNTKHIDNSGEFLDTVHDQQPVKAVVIDFDLNVNYSKIVRAQLYLENPNCILVAGATDYNVPLGDGVNMLGPGYFLDVLSRATNKKAVVLGKPGHELGAIIKDRYKIDNPKRALFIGDTLVQDIGFGKKCGFQTLAVLTGNSTLEAIKNYHDANQVPNYYANSMEDFKKIFQN